MLSMGIDASTTSTGVVLLTEDGKVPKVVHQTNIKFPKEEGVGKCRAITQVIMETVVEHKPDVIVLEGYSLNMKNASSVVPLVQLGGIIRLMFFLEGLKWLDPRASEVKQFATGKGNTKKNLMMLNVFQRWGYEAKNDDMADGYALAAMGLAYRNKLPGLTLEQRKVIGKLTLRSN